ncbi:MAG: hypothetical protein JWM88_1071 [Verrucomicrobia bacterium]|nr:hypothetical protein [Verrucomicrobiota bacterium]
MNSANSIAHRHPAVSAVGAHLDELTEIAALAQRYYEEEGRPDGRSLEHWLRAERELHPHRISQPAQEEPPSEADSETEEAMHLDL